MRRGQRPMRWGLARIALMFFLLPAPGYSAEKLNPSRPALQGCQWVPFVNPQLGVRLLVADCKDPSSRYVFSAVENRIEQHRPTDDRIFGSHLVLEMFSKKPNQTIESAIEEQFVSKLEPQAKASCKAQKLKSGPSLKGDKQTYTILPTGSYAKEIQAALQESPRDFGCGNYGAGQSTKYFEYHPSESKTRFAFVVFGWDEPLFDEDSIEFIKP